MYDAPFYKCKHPVRDMNMNDVVIPQTWAELQGLFEVTMRGNETSELYKDLARKQMYDLRDEEKKIGKMMKKYRICKKNNEQLKLELKEYMEERALLRIQKARYGKKLHGKRRRKFIREANIHEWKLDDKILHTMNVTFSS